MKRTDSLNVSFCFNEHYAPYAGVALFSLMKNLSGNIDVCAYLLHNHDAVGSLERFRQLAQLFDRLTVVPIALDGTEAPEHLPELDALHSKTGWSKAIFYRLFVDKLIAVKRLIMLDSDVLVTGDLRPLTELSLNRQPFAAVEDTLAKQYLKPLPNNPAIGERLAELSKGNYFNSGVVVIDLDWARKTKFFQSVRDICLNNPELGMPDQDAMNLVLKGDWLRLDQSWNVLLSSYGARHWMPAEERNAYNRGLNDPTILHYSGRKPWTAKGHSAHSARYFQLAAESPWANLVLPPKASLHQRAKALIHRHCQVRLTSKQILVVIGEKVLLQWQKK